MDYKPRSRGFTLIELMIVLVILGLIMGIVAPQAGSISARVKPSLPKSN